MKNAILYLLAFLIVNVHAYSQTPMLLQDINPGPESSMVSSSTPSTVFNDILFFTANDGEHGNEIWIYDGTDLQLLIDIRAGSSGVDVEEFIHFNNQLFFVVDDGVHGDEWWVTDGTETGTTLFKDIQVGPGDGVALQEYFNQTIEYQNELFFVGAKEENNFELWKTDGTEEGTMLVKNIAADNQSFNVSSYPEWFIELNDELLFSTSEGLYKSDGTELGTILVREDDPFDSSGFDPSNLTSMGDYALMYTYERLWRSDGSHEGTVPIDSFGHTATQNANKRIVKIGNRALFPARDAVSGEEMWVTDGTKSGTHLLKDIYPGNQGYAKGTITTFQGIPFFKARNSETGIELWKSDGTESGTVRVTDIAPGSEHSFPGYTTVLADDNIIYMSAGSGFNSELWLSDGTEDGTFEIDINPNGESHPNSMVRYKNFLFFGATSDNSLGNEPHILDVTMYLSYKDHRKDNLDIDIHPNPVSDLLTFESIGSEEYAFSIYDFSGKLLIRNEHSPNPINVSSLQNGQYFLRLTNKKSGEQRGRMFTVISK